VSGEGRIVDIRVVDGGTANAYGISCDISKSGLGAAGRRGLNPFVATIQFDWPIGVSGEQHHASIIGDRRSKNLRKEWR
jgi:hypothetical protein